MKKGQKMRNGGVRYLTCALHSSINMVLILFNLFSGQVCDKLTAQFY